MAHMLPALLPLCAAALVLSPAEPSPKRAWRDRIKAQRHIRPHVNPLQRRYLEQSTDHLPAALDFADKTLPLHLDIGCGKGHYCADLAEARPDRNIVGVEIREQLVEEATRLCREVTDVGNLRFVAGSANVLVGPICEAHPEATLASASINFPDPWPKRAHRKRRVVQPELVRALATHLRPDGLVLVQSDVRDLEREMAACFVRSGLFVVDDAAASSAEAAGLATIMTERARQAARRGQPTWRTLLRRREAEEGEADEEEEEEGALTSGEEERIVGAEGAADMTVVAPGRSTPPVMLANAVTNGMLGGSKFCVNVQLCIKPERRDEFIACIRNNQQGTLQTEPLAIEYVWGEDTEVANTFHFYEKYEGLKGFEAHKATPHFAAWEAFAATDPFTSEPVVNFYEEF